jgi:hypothetical protein
MGNSISLEESDDNDERGHENNIEMKITSLDNNDSIENSRENSRENSKDKSTLNRSDTSDATMLTIKKTKKMSSDASVSKKRRSTSKNGAANNAPAYRKTKSRRR